MVDAIQSAKKIYAAKKAKKKKKSQQREDEADEKKKSQRRDSHERAKDEADDFFETAMKESSKPKPKKQRSLLSDYFRPRIEPTPPNSASPLASTKRSREARDSSLLPRKALHCGAKRPLSSISSASPKSSKYFTKDKAYESQKTPKKIIRTDDLAQVRKSPKVKLQGFIDTLEEQKATTNDLNEYLALESKQKELLGSGEKLSHRQNPAKSKKFNRFASQTSSSEGKNSWTRDRERFRQKQGLGQIKLSTESSLDTWLSKKSSASSHQRSPGMNKKRVSRTSLETTSSPAASLGRRPDRDNEETESGLSFMMQKDATASHRDSHQRSPLHKKRHEPAVWILVFLLPLAYNCLSNLYFSMQVRKQGLMKSWVGRNK